MSLLTTASPWINDDSSTPKRRPSTMRKTIKLPYSNSNEEAEEYRTGETKEQQYNNNFMENYQNLEPSNIETAQKVNESRGSKINDLLNKMSLSSDNDSGKLGNFTPPPNPVLNNKKPDNSGKSANGELLPTDLLPKNNLQPNVKPLFQNNGIASGMGYVANEPSLGTYNNYKTSYEPTQISHKPYYAKMGLGNGALDDKLMEKINYMIHLLEEQQNEKSNNVTEEFILYTFLGIFIIYVVDSFARAGKYVR
jgi:hypothetical protein